MIFPPVITALYAGLCALLYLALSLRVVQARWKYKIGMGHGQNKDLATRIRTHGNFGEYVPLLLILMLILETTGLLPWMIHFYGLLIVLSRGVHAYGLFLSPATSWPRMAGMSITFFLILIGAIGCIYRYLIV